MQPIGIIVKDQEILGGTPVFRGTRVPFQALLDYPEGGQTLDEFLDDFPTVTKDAAVAALQLAQSLLVGLLPQTDAANVIREHLLLHLAVGAVTPGEFVEVH